MSQPNQTRRFPLSQHTIGPFFPADYFQPGDNDLTRVAADATPTTKGTPFTLTGTVRREGGEPVANAILELWQADSTGHFRHPDDPEADKADPDFLGWGRAWSTGEGAYSFHSIRPAGYIENGLKRAPHLNIIVMGIGLMRTAETTLFFPDHAAENATDPVLCVLPEDLRPMLVMRDDGIVDGVQSYGFDILLRGPRGQETPFFET
ncbi:protocatechuate 3,4-dioxygenase subunit alpha [Antarctobacter sp.]|uniref:protocatechuate 3,4-dioxygenase subunit alpha n=1 Tax=Antarctobacter sp. TaxID=1872577 RepID=UPI002B270CE8|nr:protocatechuate 3,4-dioxygenase subunit alpha [Antarctobacter sp.]